MAKSRASRFFESRSGCPQRACGRFESWSRISRCTSLRGSEIHNRLHGHAEAIPRGRVLAPTSSWVGHIHLAYVAPLHELLPESCSDVAGRCKRDTAVSTRVRRRHPNSVNLIRRDDAQICLAERWDYSAAERNKFQCVKVERLNLDRGQSSGTLKFCGGPATGLWHSSPQFSPNSA